jgi:aspartate 1-decarboxylase
MLLELLKSKIHRATVTDASLHYEGSLSLDPKLIKAARLLEYEKVLVVNIDCGSRLETYVITGKKGEVCLNGAAARLGQVGDRVIIMSFAQMDEKEAAEFTPAIVLVDERNRQMSTTPH